MYDGVPMSAPVRVWPSPITRERLFAMPKSTTLATSPSGSLQRKMFEGLMSLWTMPIACALPSARATWLTSAAVSRASSFPRRARRLPRSSPSRYSIAMYGTFCQMP